MGQYVTLSHGVNLRNLSVYDCSALVHAGALPVTMEIVWVDEEGRLYHVGTPEQGHKMPLDFSDGDFAYPPPGNLDPEYYFLTVADADRTWSFDVRGNGVTPHHVHAS